ncbi:MAG: hypothetical protein WDN72_05060 [Alphaproteobacteria bacterium]
MAVGWAVFFSDDAAAIGNPECFSRPDDPAIEAAKNRDAECRRQEADFNITLACRQEGRKFSFVFYNDPATTDCDQDNCLGDDMTITLKRDGRTRRLPIPKGWFYGAKNENLTDNISICKTDAIANNNYNAFALGKDMMVLFLRGDHRPGLDIISAAVINTRSGNLVDYRVIGETKDAFSAFLRTEKGYRIQLAKPLPGVYCDCAESYADEWMEIDFSPQGKIDSHWLR